MATSFPPPPSRRPVPHWNRQDARGAHGARNEQGARDAPAASPCRPLQVAWARPVRQADGDALPLFLERVPAGFPSPADGYIDAEIDLNELLIERPESTFFVRVEGDSMTGAGIHDGDVLLVDRAAEPKDGSVVIAAVDGNLTVKRLRIEGSYAWLLPAHPDYEPIELTGEEDLCLWGVVTRSIHKVA